jgi:beta-N-acetylhexosaminidase
MQGSGMGYRASGMRWGWMGAAAMIAATAAAMFAPCAVAASPVHLDRKGERWAAATLHKMTLEEKVGQMIVVWAQVQFLNPESPEYLELRDEMTKYHVGGFGVTDVVEGPQLIMSEPLEAAALINRLQKDSKYPLLIAADFERGLSMRLVGATAFPAAMAFGAAGDKSLARQFGRISAIESRAIGVQWNWFPIADVNSNPANPIIDTRSFGEDPKLVSEMVAAYIEGARSEGLLTTAKHFPGHGDTDTDSHLTLARVNANMDRLNSVELVPFRSAIAAGVDSIMMGHLIVPAIEPDPNRPASVSAHAIKDLLQGQLGFKGLVVTDGLGMAGLTHVFSGSEAEVSSKAAVAAVEAGNDMVLVPGDLGGAYNGLLTAVKRGEISKARIDQSVLKILRMKASVGLNEDRFVSLANVQEEVARPENVAIAQSVADRAITLVADAGKLVPIATRQASRTVVVIFSDRPRGSDGGRAFASELHKRAPGATVFFVDASNSGYIFKDVMAAVRDGSSVIAVAESVPNARRTTEGRAGGSANLDAGPIQLLTEMVKKAGAKTIVVAFGNPYTGESIPGIQTYVCTYSNTVVSASSLARALFGEIPIHGRLPVSIPNLAPRGTGLDRDANAGQVSAP